MREVRSTGGTRGGGESQTRVRVKHDHDRLSGNDVVQNRGERRTARGSGSVNKFSLVLKSARGVDLNGERAVRGG